ncbi:protein translocase subunit SecF [bacterium]|nr:protein translocase subunit SecF [bacterium]
MANEITSKSIINIVKYKFIWLCVTAILLLPGTLALIYGGVVNHSPLKVGIDYTGGTILQYGIPEDMSNDNLATLRASLEKAGIENPKIQVIHESAENQKDNVNIKNFVLIKTKFISDDVNTENKVTEVVASQHPGAEIMSVTSVGPTLGSELFKKSVTALIIAILGMIIYLTIRFKFTYALAAILGLVHDTLFVCGFFAILGLVFGVEVDSLFITAVLTLIGFSINDTIVTFDRIRENLRYYSKKMSFGEIVNSSVNQTISRSINTSLSTLITLLALYFFGGVTTRDFVLALMVGVIVGTWSSIFFCTVLISIWEDKDNKKIAAKPAV